MYFLWTNEMLLASNISKVFNGQTKNDQIHKNHVFFCHVDWFIYLLYVDGETAFSGGCLFTFGLTLLTCLMEFTCILTADCCCCGPVCCCCCALRCCDEPVIPPFDLRFRLMTKIDIIRYV